jgi:hypothetical protein
LAEDAALAWITNAANAVTEYFGRFPLRHSRVMVRISEATSVKQLMTIGSGLDIDVGAQPGVGMSADAARRSACATMDLQS